mmetsp:Transcript_40775/g.118127  ORF Transcript_40775/g.118127 Transcript_40775/m.118127 type:complete len:402 (-) Transcript_40775:67-1272(-)
MFDGAVKGMGGKDMGGKGKAGCKGWAKGAGPQHKGAGAAKGSDTPASIKLMEHQLTMQAGTIYETILNLNIAMPKLSQDLDTMLRLRSQIMFAYGVSPQDAAVPAPMGMGVAATPAGKGVAAAPSPLQSMPAIMGGKGVKGAKGTKSAKGAKGAKGAEASFGAAAEAWGSFETGSSESSGFKEVDYKSKLNQCVAKQLKRPLMKTDLIYTVEEVDAKQYIACLIGPEILSKEYWSETPCATRRLAEHAAAKSALEAEYPEALLEPDWVDPWGQPTKKRKFDGPNTFAGPEDPKTQLSRAGVLLLGRALGKNDIVYHVSDFETPEGKRYQATVALPEFDPDAIHHGEPAESAKQAQMNAAQVAVTAWQHIIALLEEERQAKKLAHMREKADALRAKREATGA